MKIPKIFILALCLFAICFSSCKNDNSVSRPVSRIQVTSVFPNFLARGANSVSVDILGSGFSSTAQVDLGPDIEVLTTQVLSSTAIEVIVNVAVSAASGPRSVTVTSAGSTARLDNSLAVQDNLAPVADFFVNPSSGTVGTIYILDASLSFDEDGTVTTYKWKISDETNPRGKQVKKQFDKKGTYEIRLEVVDDRGGISSSKTATVIVGSNKPPQATFSVTPTSGSQLTLFTFDASESADPDGTIQGYRWEFGDGTEASGVRVTHKYKTEGEYFVKLQVRDSNDSHAFATKTMVVKFFDRESAKAEIIAVIRDFLELFADIEHLSAQTITRGFSDSPACTGRQKEIDIINVEKDLIQDSNVQFINGPVVTYVDDQKGRANVTNRFYGTDINGNDYSGISTHYFDLIVDNGAWKICNFFVTKDGRVIQNYR